MDSVIKTLEFINSHPGCDTQEVDYHIVLDLYNQNYVDGRDESSFDGFAFKNLRLTIQGKEYLELLRKRKSQGEHYPDDPANISSDLNQHPVHGMSIKYFSYSVLIVVFAAIVFWVIHHYFGLNLG